MYFWQKLFPIQDSIKNRSMHGWQMFYEDSWLVDHLLRQDRSFGIDNGGMFCRNIDHTGLHEWRRLQPCGIDETLVTSSNILHSNALAYLWGSTGRTVFLGQKLSSTVFIPSDLLSSIERKLQKAINEHQTINHQISIVLKNALDFGVGYLAGIDGYYEAVTPMYVGRGITDMERKKFYIVDCGTSYWVFGENGEITKELGIDVGKKYFGAQIVPNAKIDNVGKKYFGAKIIPNAKIGNEEKIERVVESDAPIFLSLAFDFYRTREDIPVGCGTVAAKNVLQLNKLLDKAYYAQGTELQPPVASSSLLDGALSLGAGSINYYDSKKMSPGEVASSISAPRAGNSLSFVEFWRSSIRRIYFLDQIMARGVGQQTAVDAARNAAAASSVFAGMVRPFFKDFIDDLLANFCTHHFKKQLPGSEKAFFKLEDLNFRYIGQFTSDIANSDVSYNNILAQTIQTLAQFDPKIVTLLKADEVAMKTLEDLFPSSFYFNKREYEERVTQIAQQQIAQQFEGQ